MKPSFPELSHKAQVYGRSFRHLQQYGPRVYEPKQEEHVCLHCGKKFFGNYCPVCGQDAELERFTWKNLGRNAILSFFSVDRGFLRTLIDLLYRPGYMIRDYLAGHRAPFFKPFQLLFVLGTLLLLFINFFYVDVSYSEKSFFNEMINRMASENKVDSYLLEKIQHAIVVFQSIEWPEFLQRLFRMVYNWFTGNLSLSICLSLPFLYFALKRTFRRTEVGKNMTGPECLVTMVYVCDQILLLFFLIGLWGLLFKTVFTLFGFICWGFMTMTFSQLYQLSVWKSLRRTILLLLRIWLYMWLLAMFIGAVFMHIVLLM